MRPARWRRHLDFEACDEQREGDEAFEGKLRAGEAAYETVRVREIAEADARHEELES